MPRKGDRKAACKNGHLRTPENVMGSNRECRLCHQMRERFRYEARWGDRPRKLGAPIKAYCKRGHARTPDNLTKERECKICQKLRARRRPKKSDLHLANVRRANVARARVIWQAQSAARRAPHVWTPAITSQDAPRSVQLYRDEKRKRDERVQAQIAEAKRLYDALYSERPTRGAA